MRSGDSWLRVVAFVFVMLSPSMIHAQSESFQSVVPPRAPPPRPAPRPVLAPAPQWRPPAPQERPPAPRQETKQKMTLTGLYIHRHSFTLDDFFPDTATLTTLGFEPYVDYVFKSKKYSTYGSEEMKISQKRNKINDIEIETNWHVGVWRDASEQGGPGTGSWDIAAENCRKLNEAYLSSLRPMARRVENTSGRYVNSIGGMMAIHEYKTTLTGMGWLAALIRREWEDHQICSFHVNLTRD